MSTQKRVQKSTSIAARTSSMFIVIGFLSTAVLAACGEDEAYNPTSVEPTENRSRIVAGPASAIFYGNVDFKGYYYTMPQCIDGVCTHDYQRGAVESIIIYPGCLIGFWYRDSPAREYRAPTGRPYYVSSLAHDRDRFDFAYATCGDEYGPVLSHDAMAWSEFGLTGERLPLFIGQDWRYPDWFRKKVSSVQVISGRYLVAYVGDDEKMATSIIEYADLDYLHIDNQITKTEVREYHRSEGEVSCSTRRGCYTESDTCSSIPHVIDEEHPGLDTCRSGSGRSYCTGQGICVDAATGAPKTVSYGAPPLIIPH